MLVVADFISLGWEQTESFGAGWFKKVVGDILEEEYVLHYNFATGVLSIWNEDRKKIFCEVVESVNKFPKVGLANFRTKFIKSAFSKESIQREQKWFGELLKFGEPIEGYIPQRFLVLDDNIFETQDGEKRVREKGKSNFNEPPKK